MKQTYIRYNLIFSAFILPYLAALVLLALLTEPVTGDLTRLGGYLEEDFGWKDPQQIFTQSGFKLADNLDDYDRYYDVVVFGDSFSSDKQKGWQNVFFERTGLSIITLSMAKLSTEAYSSSGIALESIVNSPQFKAHPPRYFIFESVERDAFSRLHVYAIQPWASDPQIKATPVASQPISLKNQFSIPTREARRLSSLGAEAKIQQSVNYLVKATFRLLGESGSTRLFDLARSDLFSSGWPDHLLVVKQDTEKDLSGDAVERAARGLNAAKRLVEQNGKTRFLAMIFPDKLTVYTPYLKHPEMAAPSYLPALSAYYPMPRLDTAFQEELQKGVRDLYLPDDTHVGYVGHHLAAERLIDFYMTNSNGAGQ